MLPREHLQLVLLALPVELQQAVATFWLQVTGSFPVTYATPQDALAQGPVASSKRLWLLLGQAEPAMVRRLRAQLPCEVLLAQLAPDAPADMLLALQRAGATEVLAASATVEMWTNRLEQLLTASQASDRVGRLIVVSGVTGGGGATTIALELARELAFDYPNLPGGVLLIEVPSRLGALATLHTIEPSLTSHDLLAAGSRLQANLLEQAVQSVSPQLQVLVGPYRELPPAPPSSRALRQLLSLAQQRAGAVVVDLPCSFDDVLFESLSLAQQTVLVGVQNVSSLRAMKLVRDVMIREEGTAPPTLVINRYDPQLPGFEVQRLEEWLGTRPLLTVPADLPALMASLAATQPLHRVAPHSGLRRGVRSIALPLRGGSGLTPNAPTIDQRLRPPPPRKLRILHIEDDPFQQQIVQLHLASLPEYEACLVAVCNEQEALRAFESQPFDLVLLDYQLSQGDGLACLRRLRQRDAMVPILVLSGLSDPQVAAELLEGGADDFLSKENLVGDRLARTLSALLARSDGLKARLPVLGSDSLPEDQRDLLQRLQRIREATQGQKFEVGRLQRAVDRLLNELQADSTVELPRKELLELFLRLLSRPESSAATPETRDGSTATTSPKTAKQSAEGSVTGFVTGQSDQ
ncbi:MAG: response regulator [Gemmataceae bacterium]